jgi:uncharacterized membrane protein YbhN (UPF0104 family)
VNWRSRRLQGALAAVVLLLAGVALWQHSQSLSLAQLRAAWDATPGAGIAWALLATALSFTCLAAYERFATERVAPGRIPLAMALRVGALAHALSNTLGFHALTGSAFRYQQYRPQGLQLADVAKVLAVVALSVAAGVVLVSAVAFVCLQWSAATWPWPVQLASLAALAGLAALGWRPLHRQLAASQLPWPALARLLPVAALEMAAAIAALYVLLPAGSAPGLPAFILIFVGAMVLGIASHAPGGIGVFEATVLAALPARHQAGVLVALLLYRAIYNLLPFALAVLVLALQALRRRPATALVRGRI